MSATQRNCDNCANAVENGGICSESRTLIGCIQFPGGAWASLPDAPAAAQAAPGAPNAGRKHPHYFKDVSGLATVDVYRVLQLFGVTDQALGHAVKKLLVAGGRGAGKDIGRDVQEAIDTLTRWQEMRAEDQQGERQ